MAETPNTVHGRLLESVHISGYSFERACGELEWLLDEDRWKQVAGGFSDINAFLATIDLSEFRIAIDQRKKLAERLKAIKASQRATGKLLGVSQATITNDLRDEQKCSPAGAVAKGDPGANEQDCSPPWFSSDADPTRAAKQDAKKSAAAAQTKERREASRAAEALPDGMELRIGDCRKVLADIPGNSVPLILTDPPYGDEAEPLYDWLGEFARRVLIPGGSLICFTGQSRLNRDMRILDGHLRYWWLLAMEHDQSQRLPGKFVIAEFKPVLWYVKETRRGRSLVPDVLRPTARDKNEHRWSQGDGGIWPLIEHLTEPGETIVDPFAGTATWGHTAVAMGRRWIGADVVAGGDTVAVA